MTLRISLLGQQTIEDEATGAITSRSSRTLALVGYLVTHPGAQPRQQIAGLFWPESTDAQALTNLRRELHLLRRVLLDDPALVVTSADLQWRESNTCVVDVHVVQRARGLAQAQAQGQGQGAATPGDLVAAATRGVAAYGGDFLPAVYDDWAVDERDRLRRACVDLCDVLSDRRARQDDLAAAVEAARRRIELEPLEEVGYRSLMQLQVELGDRGGAISTYHHCASVLERELGVEPAAETRRLRHQLIGEDTVTPRAGAPGPSGGADARTLGTVGSTALVGRETPLARLQELWASTLAEGRPRVVVVRGLAGVGKSRLVSELADRVRAARGTVATSQCFDISGRLALAPVADWLRSADLQPGVRGLDPRWRLEVERLVPLTDSPPGPSAVTGDRSKVDAWQRHRFFEGLAQAFLVVDRPMLLVLDNLQWCDEETLSWLAVLLTLAHGRRLLVACTLRDEQGPKDPVVADWLARLRTVEAVEEVPLAPLAQQDTATLSAAIGGRPVAEEEARLLQATTGGFPLYVVEAARSRAEERDGATPEGRLGTVLRRRIAQTSPRAQEVAGLAAALGRDFTLDVLTEASDLDADAVALAVDELWRRHIVHELGTGYDFTHDLIRDAAYDEVSPPRRWLLHRRLAQALELTSAGQEDDVAALLAEQYERGGRPDRAREYYDRAAEVAAARFATAEAIRLHRRALAIIGAHPSGRQRDQRELDCLLAIASPLNASKGYSSPELRSVLERAVELAEGLGSVRTLVPSLVALWASRFVQGDVVDSLRLASRALDVAGVDDVLLGEAHFAFAGSSASLGRPAVAVQHFDEAHDRCRGAESLAVGTMPDVHALAWAAHAHWQLGQWGAAVDRADEAIARARGNHPYSLAVALAYAGVTHQLLGDGDALRACVDELAGLCSTYGFAYYDEWATILGGWEQGGPEGVAAIRSGIARLRSQSSLVRMPYWLGLQADAVAREGRPAEAVALLDAAHAAGSLRGDAWWLPEIERMRASHATGAARDRLLRSALALAERQGSVALVERCRADLPAAGRAAAFAEGVEGANAARTGPS